MNRTIKDATVKRFYYETHDEIRGHLADFVAAYNYARRLNTLRGLAPYEAICKAWLECPSLLSANQHHQLPGPNIKLARREGRSTQSMLSNVVPAERHPADCGRPCRPVRWR